MLILPNPWTEKKSPVLLLLQGTSSDRRDLKCLLATFIVFVNKPQATLLIFPLSLFFGGEGSLIYKSNLF